MSPSGADVLRQIKDQIDEVDPAEAREQVTNGAVLVDVREPEEWAGGHVPGAKHVRKSYLESRIEGAVPDRSQHVILYCASGNRSAWAARTLLDDLGYEHVESMTGGFTLWKDRGYEVQTPRTLTAEQRERYSRHLLLPEVGIDGQQKLLDARVLLVGAGRRLQGRLGGADDHGAQPGREGREIRAASGTREHHGGARGGLGRGRRRPRQLPHPVSAERRA